MNMCSAFAHLGHEVTLVVPCYEAGKKEPNIDDVFAFYGVPNVFNIKYVKKPSIPGGIYFRAIKSALFCRKNHGLVYSRDYWGSLFASYLNVPVCHEFHQPLPQYSGVRKWLTSGFHRSKLLTKIIVISDALKEIFLSEAIKNNKLLVAHDAASEDISIPLELPKGFHVGYVGHLYEGRGIELIFEIASLLPEVTFHIIGGNDQDITKHKKNNPPMNIIFHGFKLPSEVGSLRKSMDVLIAPYQKDVRVWGGKINTVDYMSPLKIFEYMSSKKPIIVSELPVIREVLDETNAVLCNPEDTSEWVLAIRKLRNDPEYARQISEKAHEQFLKNYTWHKRATKILSTIDNEYTS